MPDEKPQTPATDAVKALARFLHEPEIENEPREKIQAELKNAGIDTAALMKTVREKVDQAKSRQRLGVARARREALLKELKRLKELATAGGAKVRARVKEILDAEFAGQPDAAVLFRKFEEAKDEDLQTLLDDILLLDKARDEEQRPGS
jgi:restriction endonuclease Mrr